MIEEALKALATSPARADRLLSAVESTAFSSRDEKALAEVWPVLAEARTNRRAKAAAGRIDLHTHTTASDGEMTVQQLLCDHFVQGQILIDDHNIIESLPEARRLVHERDLELDLFLGIEVICTHQRRAFEFHAIAPTYSDSFVALCLEHRQKWEVACERFVDEFAQREDMFDDPLWQQILADFSVGGSMGSVIERYAIVREKINRDPAARKTYLKNNQTFDMGNLWQSWGLAREGDPPMLAHRFFASMRCYAMNAYRNEWDDWFDYAMLARRFQQIGCFVSHNHPNYWDEDFVGEIRHEVQTEWIRDLAERGTIDALEVWSPPFASQRVPEYWRTVCNELNLVPMAGTDCHSGREQQLGGDVENHAEIPPQIYAKLAASAINKAKSETEPWAALAAWRDVLEIDYAQTDALRECVVITRAMADGQA